MDRDLSAQVFLLTQKHVAHGIGVYAQQKRAPAPAIGGLQLPGQEDGISAFGKGQNV